MAPLQVNKVFSFVIFCLFAQKEERLGFCAPVLNMIEVRDMF